MSTTNLFVELVVIGTGAALWVSLAIFSVFDYTWVSFDRVLSIPALIPGLSLIYVLGIVVDRLADWVFEYWAKSLCREWFASPKEYHYARTLIYTRSDALKALFEYSRSRLRICRGWTINCMFIIGFLNTFVWIRLPAADFRLRLKLSVFGSLAFGLFALGSWRAWYRLAGKEYRKLSEQFTFLKEEESIAKTIPKIHNSD